MAIPKSYYLRPVLARLDDIPPPLCRLIARERIGPRYSNRCRILTIREIASRAGLTWQKCAYIARQKSFARIAVEDADKFRLGCGITPENEFRHRCFIRDNIRKGNRSFAHLFESTKREWPGRQWQNRFFETILKRL